MTWDRRELIALAGGFLIYVSTPSCTGGAFGSKTDASAGDGATAAIGGKPTSGAGGKSGAESAAGASSVAGKGGVTASAGSAGAAANGGRAGSSTGGVPTMQGNAGEPAGGAPEPSVPISTDKLVLWFKADAGVTNNEGVSKWADQSGNGFDATQALHDLRPKLSMTQLLPLPVLDFDGTDDLLELPALKPDLTAGLSLFAVAGRGADSTCSAIVELSNGSEINDINFGSLGNSFQYEVQDESVPAAADAFPVGQVRLLEVLHSGDPVQPEVELRVNGTLSGSVAIKSPLDILRASNFIGHSLYVDCQYYSGAIAEIIFYSRKLEADERANVEQYLMNKWSCCKQP